VHESFRAHSWASADLRRAPARLRSRRPVSTSERDSGCRLAVKRFALGPAGRDFGDGVAGHPLGGSEVGAGPRHGRDRDGDVLLQAVVARGVVWGAVLPAAPQHPAPGAPDGSQRARVVVAAGTGGGVAVLRPGVPVAGAVRQRAERCAQPFVASPPEAGCFTFAGLDRDGGLAGVAGKRVAGWVARAAVADLGQQLRGADHAVGVLEQRQEDRAVGMGA
jgi:hypothetical protein